MAIVKVNYTRSRNAAKATIRYITNRPEQDGLVTRHSIYNTDGDITKDDAFQMIDLAKRGAVFFRIFISPDPQTEDALKDLYLWHIAEQTFPHTSTCCARWRM